MVHRSAVAVLILLVAACAPAMQGPPPLGQTVCVGDEYYAFDRTAYAPRVPMPETVQAHEAVHRQQGMLVGTCAEWDDFKVSSERRARIEAQAFCASAVESVNRRYFARLEDAVVYFARVLATYPLDLDVAAAEKLIWRFCS